MSGNQVPPGCVRTAAMRCKGRFAAFVTGVVDARSGVHAYARDTGASLWKNDHLANRARILAKWNELLLNKK